MTVQTNAHPCADNEPCKGVMTMTNNIYTYIVPLPPGFNEAVMPCIDGFTIYIADHLSPAGRLKAYKHALWHIEHDDWKRFSVQQIERDAHG